MTISTLPYYAETLVPVYSGDPATRRYQTVASNGTKVLIDIIQSLPKKGRWRHVVRCQLFQPKDVVTGLTPSMTMTFTVDHPDDQSPSVVVDTITGFVGSLSGFWDEIVVGQQ